MKKEEDIGNSKYYRNSKAQSRKDGKRLTRKFKTWNERITNE